MTTTAEPKKPKKPKRKVGSRTSAKIDVAAAEESYLEINARELTIGYYFPETGEFGLMFGPREEVDPTIRLVAQALAAYASKVDAETTAFGEWAWPSPTAARAALRIARAAEQAAEAKAWPDWATQALQAGWVPPAGWKP